jgi:hypothetical protein
LSELVGMRARCVIVLATDHYIGDVTIALS